MLRDILLRIVEQTGFTTKGSDLTNEEVDNNFLTVYNAVRVALNPEVYPAFDSDTTYAANDFSVVDGILYTSLQGDNIGHTPGESGSEEWWEEAVELEYFTARSITAQKGITAYEGGGQENAIVLEYTHNRIDSAATENASTKSLPARRAGSVLIYNRSTNPIQHYPADGESIVETGESNSPITIPPNTIVLLFSFEDGFQNIIYSSNPITYEGSQGVIDLSDTSVYNVELRTLSIPSNIRENGKLKFTADLYSGATTYATNDVVRSDGSSGGEEGKVYKSLTNGNLGNLLSDGTKWAYADAANGNIGSAEIISFGNPTTLSTSKESKFEVDDVMVKMIATPIGGFSPDINEGEIALDANADVLIESIGFLTLDSINGIARNVARGLIS